MHSLDSGASISPWGHDAFSPLFQISPLFSKNFLTLWKIVNIYLFPKNFSVFIRQNFWWPFFSHRPQMSLYFSCFWYISPLFCENYTFSTLLWQISLPVLGKFTCFLHTFCVFRFPPTLTMMHLCITQCTYWTPLTRFLKKNASLSLNIMIQLIVNI